MTNYTELKDMQVKAYHDASLALDGFTMAQAAMLDYRGWMYFKKVGSREYLFHALDRQNNGRSLGARSPETEARLSAWQAEKAAANTVYTQASEALESHRAVCKALRLGRFPKTAAKLLRLMANVGVSKHFTVIGTNALYAYESLAGVHFMGDLTATQDFDLLWDARKRITFMADGEEQAGGLMAVLKKADRTFTRNTERSFQAINAAGFAVDVLRPEEPALPALIAADDGITPIHLKGLEYLLSMPLVTETVIAEDGFPLRIQVPDPAAFALHKLWVSVQPDRRADKARRDRSQAAAVAGLIEGKLPQFSFAIDRIQNMAPALLDHLEQVLAAPASPEI